MNVLVLMGSPRLHGNTAELCKPNNANSWKLLERLGFKKGAHFRQNVYFETDEQGNPVWKDTFVYVILSNE